MKEYSIYVERVRKYRAVMPIEQAVEKAVTECIRENILADFLKKQRAEVVAMSILEYNEEEEIKKIRASERRGGYDDGWNAGRIEGEVNRASGKRNLRPALRKPKCPAEYPARHLKTA